MKVILGLGNPGSEYADTRHNVGWHVLDRLVPPANGCRPAARYSLFNRIRGWFARQENAPSAWRKGDGPYLEALFTPRGDASGSTCSSKDVLLVKPLTYMNRSGQAAAAVSESHNLDASDILVIVDDIHLNLADMRLRKRGSTGGHNGLASLSETLGTDEYPRLRIGVGAPPSGTDLIDFVLSPFSDEERHLIHEAAEHAAYISEAFGRGGYALAATAYSRWKDRSADGGSGTELPDPSAHRTHD